MTSIIVCVVLYFVLVCVLSAPLQPQLLTVLTIILDSQGPIFVAEPQPVVIFSNDTGALLHCSAHGSPPPKVQWTLGDGSSVGNIPEIRQILSNGSLYFPPFSTERYRPDIHSGVYRCDASNDVGKILSREVHVRGIMKQRYEVQVHDVYVMNGNTAIMKCIVPTIVKEFVSITSWVQDSFNIYPSVETDGKHHMLPSGDLLIYNVTPSDSYTTYRCRTVHHLTGETIESINRGRVVVTEHHGAFAPSLSDHLNVVHVRDGESAVLSCVSQGFPPPSYRWYRKNRHQLEPVMFAERYHIRQGVLVIEHAQAGDAGKFVCVVNNSAGSEQVERQLNVFVPLTVHLHPQLVTVDLGKNTEFTCTASGFPTPSISWTKDGVMLRQGDRVLVPDSAKLQLNFVERDDKGMYQCFAKNEYEMVQATAELRLGDAYPQLMYKFIEQTLQPEPHVSLKCIATGNPTPQISWTLDGFPLPHNDRYLIGQYVTVHGDVISHVNITSVQVEDGGEYECKATNRVGSAKHSARLNIYGLPHIRPMSKISAVAGEDLVIKCPVAGYPIQTITWEKDGQLLPVNHRQDVSPNGTLLLRTVDRTTDRGKYTCTVRNKQGYSDSKSVDLQVMVPPKIAPIEIRPNIQVGSHVHINCFISEGDPPLTISWMKDGRPVKEHIPDVKIRQVEGYELVLVIGNVSRSHNGNYTCVAKNPAAENSLTALLLVHVPPRIAPFSFNKDLSAGKRAQLTCGIESGDPPFTISWLKDSKPIPPSLGLKTLDIDAYSSTIVIENVTSSHTGNFTCLAKNMVAEVSHTAELVVSVPPVWVKEPQHTDAKEGLPLTIHCQAEGFPRPNVTWSKSIGRWAGNYRNVVSSQSGIRVHGNGSLFIHRLQEEHEGYYMCEAINGVGNGLSKVIYLNVNVPAQFSIKERNQTVRSNDKASLLCEAKGDKPMHLIWRKGQNRLDSSSNYRISNKETNTTDGVISELGITNTIREDSGEYFCIASNLYGQDKMTLWLFIQEPPDFPRNLQVIEKGSRSVKLGWILSQDGNSPIKKYIVEYKLRADNWHDHTTHNVMVLGTQPWALLTGLHPATNYQFRLFAENDLGRSQPSDVLDVITDAEKPGGPPNDIQVTSESSTSLRVTWKPPNREDWNGDIIGYYVGYRASNSEQYQFVSVEGRYNQGSECLLTDLKKFTRYDVVVQAHNAVGAGPLSNPLEAVTLEDVPGAPPRDVRCTALTPQSLQVSWEKPPDSEIHGALKGYKVFSQNLDSYQVLPRPVIKITQALTVVIHGLEKYTNYSVHVLAFTRVGDGIPSQPLYCVTEEDVPEAPADIKAVVNSSSSIIVSWLPPEHSNGIIIQYNLHVRVIGNGQEVQSYIRSLPPQQTYYEAEGLHKRETYKFSVAALTKIGEGPKSKNITISPSNEVRAAIYSFGSHIIVPWKKETSLPCLYVGRPKHFVDWKQRGQLLKSSPRFTSLENGSLLITELRREDGGNYSCHVKNRYGSDHITHHLTVQVPPEKPLLHPTTTTISSINLQWKQSDDGGAPVQGFVLHYKREHGEWEERKISRLESSYILDKLWCGTRYQIYITAYNKIGMGKPSEAVVATTHGTKPGSVSKERFLFVNSTAVTLYFENWDNGGCPLLYFEVEYRKSGDSEWTLVSNNAEPRKIFTFKSLEPSTRYQLRVTAHNNAGSSAAEYSFRTLNKLGGTASPSLNRVEVPSVPFYLDVKLIVPIIVSAITVVVAMLGVCFCLKKKPTSAETSSVQESQTAAALDNQQNMEQREQYYATVRKSLRSPVRDMGTLERIPEYSEDIYPYATFELSEPAVESRCTSAAPLQTFVYHDPHLSATETLQVRETSCTMDQSLAHPQSPRQYSNENLSLGEDEPRCYSWRVIPSRHPGQTRGTPLSYMHPSWTRPQDSQTPLS